MIELVRGVVEEYDMEKKSDPPDRISFFFFSCSVFRFFS
jgi:hypothetical protein